MTSDAIPEDHSDEAQIAAEIADHLATAAAELQQQGLSPGAAQTAALSKFGDIRTIKKQCYWAKNGETMMFRWGMIALLTILVLFVGITALGSWRTQSHLTAQIDKLTEQLGNLAKTQQAAQQQVPLEIAGQVFEGGDRFKRQSGVRVEIINTIDGKVVFSQSTDSFGEYSSGRLPEGEYSVICRRKNKFLEVVQSAPISLYPGVGKVLVDVDIADLPAAGPIKVSLSNALPSKRVEGKYQLHSALYIKTGSARNRNAIWTKQNLLPNTWPLYCQGTEANANPEKWLGFHYALTSEDVAAAEADGLISLPVSQAAEPTSYDTLPLPAGEALIAAYIFTEVEPLMQSDLSLEDKRPKRQPLQWHKLLPRNVADNFAFSLGASWSSMENHPSFSKDTTPFQAKVTEQLLGGIYHPGNISFSGGIWPDQTLDATAISLRVSQDNVMRIEVPEELEKNICNILETYQTPDQNANESTTPSRFQESYSLGNTRIRTLLAVPAKITVIEAKGEQAKAE